MKKKRTTEINLEVEEAVSITTHTVLMAYCRRCGRKVRMVAANEAAVISRLSAREVYRLVEAARLHFTEDQGGMLYVCSESLRNLVSKQDSWEPGL